MLSILINHPSSEHSLPCKVEIVSTEQCHLLTTAILFSLSLNLLSEVHSIRKIIQYFISWNWLICLTCPYNTWYNLYQHLFSLEACTRISFLWRLLLHHTSFYSCFHLLVDSGLLLCKTVRHISIPFHLIFKFIFYVQEVTLGFEDV